MLTPVRGPFPPFPSDADGVGQPARFACLGNWSNRSEPSSLGLMSAPLSFQSLVVVVVTQPAICAKSRKSFACGPIARAIALSGSLYSPPALIFAVGVGQPLSDKPEALTDVRRTDARSAQIGRPNGVSRCFHVSAYSVEPAEAVLTRNLFSKDDWRSALCDEPVKLGPEVTLVLDALALARCGEGLAGAGAGPDGAIIRPPGKA